MKNSKNSGITFLAAGAAFLSLGMSNPAFVGVGVALLGLGAGLMRRGKCGKN